MKKEILVSYLLSLIGALVAGAAVDHAFVTADGGWIIVSGIAGLMSLIFFTYVFSNWKN